MRSADFLVTFRAQPGDDQIALFVEEEKPVAVFHDEGIGPADRFAGSGCLEGFPNAFSSSCFQAAQLAVTANAINIIVLEKWCAHNGIKMRGILLARLFGPPKCTGRWFARIELHHERAVVKTSELEQVPLFSRRGNGHARPRFERFSPITLAALRVERVGRFSM